MDGDGEEDTRMLDVRVLEQDTCDQIRIGFTYPVFRENLDKEAENVKKAYGRRMAWCGGWTDENNNRYHERIALVDAVTLQPVREIWNKEH